MDWTKNRLAFRQEPTVHAEAQAIGVRGGDIIIGADNLKMEMTTPGAVLTVLRKHGHYQEPRIIGNESRSKYKGPVRKPAYSAAPGAVLTVLRKHGHYQEPRITGKESRSKHKGPARKPAYSAAPDQSQSSGVWHRPRLTGLLCIYSIC